MSGEEFKHAKVKEYSPQADGSTRIDTRSYHDTLSAHKVEIMQHIKTNGQRYLSDIIASSGVLKERKVSHLVIDIQMDNNYEPRLITRTYVASKSEFGKS